MLNVVPLPNSLPTWICALILLNDPKTGCQAQARAFAGRFGGKIRFKQVRLNFIGHSGAGVGNGQQYMVARMQIMEIIKPVRFQSAVAGS